jgi:hypothetical protein
MRVMEDVDCSFVPTSSISLEDLDGDAAARAKGGILHDLFIPASCGNCPHPAVRNRPDGHVTGDLFEEVQPGYYAFREPALAVEYMYLLNSGLGGRNDDWIRTGPGCSWSCDTK